MLELKVRRIRGREFEAQEVVGGCLFFLELSFLDEIFIFSIFPLSPTLCFVLVVMRLIHL
jgi:hypothetical protein